MSDSHEGRLGELERAWREAGTAAAEARYLAARVQAADLGEEWVELAAFLGAPGPRAALDELPSKGRRVKEAEGKGSGLLGALLGRLLGRARSGEEAAEDWARQLEPWGGEACIRAAMAAFRLLALRAPAPPGVAEVVRLASGCIARRGEGIAEVRIAVRELQPGPDVLDPSGRASPEEVENRRREWDANHPVEAAARDLVAALDGEAMAERAARLVGEAARVLGAERARAAVRAEVAPWALGYADACGEDGAPAEVAARDGTPTG